MKEDQPQSELEKAEGKLYKRGFQETYAPVRPDFYSQNEDVSGAWGQEKGKGKKEKKVLTMFQKIFFASITFFVLAAGASLILFFSGGNVVSNENVHIDIVGPIAIPGGEELSLQVAVTNGNHTQLEYSDLSVQYPDGTRNADGTAALPRTRKSFGVIKAGETVQEIIRSSLYGKEGTRQTIKVSLEYRVAGSNAIFVKETEYQVSLSSAPLSVSIETLSEVNANQEIELRIHVASNAQAPLENVLLRAQYPFGFEPSDANPRPRYGTTVWDLGTMKPGDVIPIQLKGIIRGQDNEEKVFTFTAGRKDEKNERDIGAVYSLATAEVSVRRAFLSVTPHVAGSADEQIVVDAGERVPVEIVWVNNLPSRVVDVSIEVSLEGLGFDKGSVQVTDGVYRSADNKIIWNSGTFKKFSALDAGESGVVSFVFTPIVAQKNATITHPQITMRINIFGRRVNDVGAMEDLSSLATREIIVNSDLRGTARALYFSGPFQNSGPLPPRVDQRTLYTVIWTITNSSNDITRTVMRGVLPPYVSWVGRIEPAGQNISFDQKTGEVIWKPGDIPAGAGFSKSPVEVAFQIAFTPSVSLIGKEPDLLAGISLQGSDRFTGGDIKRTIVPISTNLLSDPSFVASQSQVVK